MSIGSKAREHTMHASKSLNWLKIQEQIKFKFALILFKSSVN